MDNLSRLVIFTVVAISYIYQIVNNNYHELYNNNSYIYINTNNVIIQSKMNMNLNKWSFIQMIYKEWNWLNQRRQRLK